MGNADLSVLKMTVGNVYTRKKEALEIGCNDKKYCWLLFVNKYFDLTTKEFMEPRNYSITPQYEYVVELVGTPI